MSAYNIHERARLLSIELRITLPDAYSELSRRSAARRREKAKYGRTFIGSADRAAFSNVEPPRARLPYCDD